MSNIIGLISDFINLPFGTMRDFYKQKFGLLSHSEFL